MSESDKNLGCGYDCLVKDLKRFASRAHSQVNRVAPDRRHSGIGGRRLRRFGLMQESQMHKLPQEVRARVCVSGEAQNVGCRM